jgi:hypothetical protein
LNDDFPLITCKVKNDAVLFLIYKVDGFFSFFLKFKGKWEEVDVSKPEDLIEEEEIIE